MKVEKVKTEFEPVVITLDNEAELGYLRKTITVAMNNMGKGELESWWGKFSHDLLTKLEK